MRNPAPARLSLVLALLVAAGASPALATFPGSNQHVAWTTILDPGTSAARLGIVVDTLPITNTPLGASDSYPSWSPDGKKLVYVRQTNDPFAYWIESVNADGTGRKVWINVTQAGYPAPTGPVWDRDGSHILFRSGGDTWLCSIDSQGGANCQPSVGFKSDIDISVRGQLLRKSKTIGDPPDNRLLWTGGTEGTGTILVIIPGAIGVPFVDLPVWMPDGDTIVFRAVYNISEQGEIVNRTEWFKIRRDDSGLDQLTKSEDVCPAPGLQPEFSFSGAAPSPDGDLINFVGTRRTLKTFDSTNNSCTYNTTNGVWGIHAARSSSQIGSASGGVPRVVHEDQYASGRPSWQSNPQAFVVRIDDGRGNPLEGLKVQLFDLDGSAPLGAVPENSGGSYSFGVTYGTYRVRATLMDTSTGGPSFEVRHAPAPGDPDEAVWLEKTIVHLPGVPVPRFTYDSTAGNSNVSGLGRFHLDDMANIYFRTKQFVDWVRANLTAQTGNQVRLYAYATVSHGGDDVVEAGAFYDVDESAIYLSPEDSDYSARDGSASAIGPENDEWHEFTHHLMWTFVDARSSPGCTGVNHAGYKNPDTCDSLDEGFSIFLAAWVAQDIEGVTDSQYDGFLQPLESHYAAWDKSGVDEREDFAVAALLWDLVDRASDTKNEKVIGSDGAHHDVIYSDDITLTLGDLWNHLRNPALSLVTVDDLRQSFGTVEPSIDLDDDGAMDIAPIDELFLMHGFHPVTTDQQITPTHKDYHFAVTGGLPYDVVGRTDHAVLDQLNNVTTPAFFRQHVPRAPKASIEVNVRTVSGTPLSGAILRLTTTQAGQSEVTERRLQSGDAAVVPLEPPPYFSYVLPIDAPGLPPCDPVNDHTVSIALIARLNGYDSTNSYTFDNCAYWHAVEASTGNTAMSFTMTFPDDATPPVSSVQASASVPPTNGATTGSWTIQFSCSDPVAGPYASGCYRTEYRINGGAIVSYMTSLELTTPGTYTVEFRSVDGAGNTETFQSATYTVLAQPDTDGDGLSDAYEATLGTNPNNPDSDGDGLRDDAELTHGTNPLVADTDADGLTDGDEVTRGTNPLIADTDGDGLSDGAEVAAGFNPLVADMDGDRRLDGADNCPFVVNFAQLDSDGDGKGELCDNCPSFANAAQTDSDSDGAGDACDCASSEGAIRAPGVASLTASKSGGSTIVLSWPALTGADDYFVTVGTRADLLAGDFGSCSGSTAGATTFQSSQVPAPGQLLVYLVQGQSYSCGMGSLGFGAGDTRRTNTDPAACLPFVVVDRTATSGTATFGTVSGDHTATFTADGTVLTVTEVLSSGGSPSTRFSRLEYRFTVNVAAAPQIQLRVKGWRSPSTDGDDFRFEWSTDGTTFAPVSMPSLPTVSDGTYRTGALPASLTGNVTIRVVDTDRTAGHQTLDQVTIDQFLVRSISP